LENTVCTITGHRPARFKFKYNEHYKLCIKIKKVLRQYIESYYAQGVRKFWTGGSIGVDTWASEIILQMKKEPEFYDIELYVAIPFPGFDAKFDAKQKARLKNILADCTESIVVSDAYSRDAYRRRNYYMVDQSDCVLAVYDNDRSLRSGTGMTVHYAQKKGLTVVLIHPDTAVVTIE